MQRTEEVASKSAASLLAGRVLPLPETGRRLERFWWDTFVDVRRLADSRKSAVDAVIHAVRSELEAGQAAVSPLIGPACLSLILTGHLHLAGALIGEVLARYPSSFRARLQLSKVHFWSGNLEAARSEIVNLCREDQARLTNPLIVQCMLAFRAWDALSEVRDVLVKKPSDDPALNSLHKRVSALLGFARERNADSRYRTLCINLDRDVHRFDGVLASYREIGLPVSRRPGVFGESVPGLAKKHVLPAAAPHNMVGCCLSHLSVWESVCNGPEGFTLVLEDDGLPNFNFNLGALIDRLPADVDLCFLNDRLAPDWAETPQKVYSTVTLDEAWNVLPQSTRAVGGDAYLLSRRGAEKLVEIVAKAGITISLDWFLCAMGLDAQRRLGEEHADSMIRRARAPIRNWPQINARVAVVPLVTHQPLGFTARHHFAGTRVGTKKDVE